MSDKPVNHATDVWIGVGITALLHLLLFIYPEAFLFIGVSQLVYMLPVIVVTAMVVRKRTGILQGMMLGMGITFLLNVACVGFVFFQFLT
ncbi:MAG: hypothetical protein DF221_09840 [Brevibacillus sp.]|nr:MAG: hypothetical protein DF221_09840 [Brevibacillus sp.]